MKFKSYPLAPFQSTFPNSSSTSGSANVYKVIMTYSTLLFLTFPCISLALAPENCNPQQIQIRSNLPDVRTLCWRPTVSSALLRPWTAGPSASAQYAPDNQPSCEKPTWTSRVHTRLLRRENELAWNVSWGPCSRGSSLGCHLSRKDDTKSGSCVDAPRARRCQSNDSRKTGTRGGLDVTDRQGLPPSGVSPALLLCSTFVRGWKFSNVSDICRSTSRRAPSWRGLSPEEKI